jgi:leucyl-tRNA synthetase
MRRLQAGELMVGVHNELVSVAGSGAMNVLGGAPVGTRRWYELSPIEQQEVLAEHRLAYLDEALVNWCPALGTVLANEEVTSDGRSDRGNHPVYRRPLASGCCASPAYAERLADELALVDWPESIKVMQRNWIGRSEGAVVDFPIDGQRRVDQRVHHRPDTLFGATYMVLSPEHPLVEQIATAEHRAAVQEYQAEARSGATRPRGPGQDRRVHRRPRGESRQRRADTRLDRRLRADGLWHRRDHGGARP